jgi:hypothetical protein
MRRRTAAVVLAVLALAGCSGSVQTEKERTIEDHERGYRFVLPPGWRMIGYEARSHSGSLLTIDVHSLVGADSEFVAGLPQSIVPQLEAWTLYYFTSVERPTTSETTIGGAPALQVVFQNRIRPQDPPSIAEYWVVRNGYLLYVLRATYPPGLADAEGPAVRQVLSSWTFITATAPGAKPIPLAEPPPRS